MDYMVEEALAFITANQNNPFFLYLPFPVPHVSLQVPEDSLQEYEGAFPETPYKGEKGYVPHIAPLAAYAAMITRMDREIGKIMARLKKLGLEENTIVFFSSDNGPTYAGGVDAEFFKSAGPLRGLKGSLYEGGIRVPMIARWPGRIPSGTSTDHISAFWDVMPTLADIAGLPTPRETDGISFLPALLGNPIQIKHISLYWEHYSGVGQTGRSFGQMESGAIECPRKNRRTHSALRPSIRYRRNGGRFRGFSRCFKKDRCGHEGPHSLENLPLELR
jgi:arylsulfatase A